MLAKEILSDYKKQNKRLFIMWIITFIALIGVTCYLVYLRSNIGVTETTTTQQTIEDVETIDNSNIINGDNYGKDSTN